MYCSIATHCMTAESLKVLWAHADGFVPSIKRVKSCLDYILITIISSLCWKTSFYVFFSKEAESQT